MRVKMLVTKEKHVDGVLSRYEKGSQWNVSDEEGQALIDAGEAEDDPDVVYESEQSRRKAIRETGAEMGVGPEIIEECVADASCTYDEALDRFEQSLSQES